MPSSALKRQLEVTRFDRAMEVSESLALHRALLTTAELARLNNILTGSNPGEQRTESDEGPWRKGTVTITLPSGKTETLAVIADPVIMAREKLHRATELAESGDVIEAALSIYTGLVLAHVFEDANRRTAVLACHYFLKRYGVPLSGSAIHELGLGDLREPGEMESLRETVKQMAKFAAKKGPSGT